jgi:hypothetical protein
MSGFISLLLSCGMVHSNLPPYPLGHGKYLGYVTLSYDLNGLTSPDLGMSFYWGIGKRINLGFGFGSPINLQHITLAQYTRPDNVGLGNYYLSARNTFPSYYDLNVEVGASYIRKKNKVYNQFSSGIWFFPFGDKRQIETYGLSLFFHQEPNKMNANDNTIHFRPFINYTYFAADLKFSIHNSIGMTKNMLSRDFRLLESIQPITIINSEIDKIQYSDADSLSNSGITISLKNNDVFLLENYIGPVDVWLPDPSRMRIIRLKPNDGYSFIFLAYARASFDRQIIGFYEIKNGEIHRQEANRGDIILKNTPEYSKKVLNHIKWYEDDWSINFAIRTKH